jgi:hypothetical protein
MKKRIGLRFESLRASAIRQLGELQTITEAERQILQKQYDARSERWQRGARGEAAQDEIDHLQSFEDDIQSMLDSLEDADLNIPPSSERP